MDRSASPRPLVAVYRDALLSPSETYIREQAESLRRHRSVYVGTRRTTPGLALPADRVLLLREEPGYAGRLREFAFKRFGAGSALARPLRALRPVVLHAHTGIDGAVALPLARRLGVPLVTTFHGFDITATDETLRRMSARCHAYLRRRERLKREAAVVLAVSESIRERLLAAGYPEERVRVHHIGVDTARFQAPPGIAREPLVFLVGRLIEKKGVRHLLAAMREVQARLPEVELVVAGEGPLGARLAARALELGVRCRFVGRVTPDEVRDWMARARVVAVPSVTAANGDAEGLPIVALEAMAMGTPVVGSSTAGIPEAVVHGVTGLLGPAGDEAALARNLLAMLSDPERRTAMGDAARRRVLERFDLARQTAALEDVYDAARAVHGRRAA